MRQLYIYTEDFIGAYIGPFTDIPAVLEHIKFCHERGDGSMSNTAASIKIMMLAPTEFDSKKRRKKLMLLTPEEDRATVEAC